MNEEGPGPLRRMIDRALGLRDRLLLNPNFTSKISGYPLARGMARKQAGELFDLCAGFVYSQVLAACVRLGLFDILAEGPQETATLATRLGLPRESAERLLRAAVALKLAELRGEGRFGLGMLGAAVIANPGIARMVEHHAALYEDLRDPVALLKEPRRKTALGAYWPYAAEDRPERVESEGVRAYSELMSASQVMVANEVLAAYSFNQHRSLLDLGGGDGTFLSKVASRYPALRLMLFDLPAVADRAKHRFSAMGLSQRASVAGGSFFTDALPEGADVVSLVRVLHEHNDDAVRKILITARKALPPGGTLLIAEPLADSGSTRRVGDAYFGFYLLAMGSGRARSLKEYRALLAETGFCRVRCIPTRIPLITGLITART